MGAARRWKQDEMSRFRMRAGTGILSQDRWHLRDTSQKEGTGGKKDNGGTQREFEESWRNPREGAYVCARTGRRMTPLRLARSDCPIVVRGIGETGFIYGHVW